MSLKKMALYALALALPMPALASVWLADLDVSSMTAERGEDTISYEVEITNRVDDTARNLQARFFLPHGAEFVSTDTDECEAGPTIADQTGVVECHFDWLSPRQSVTFTVVTTLPEEHPYNAARDRFDSTATVFVFSDSPDWNMDNNVASVDAD